MNGYGFPPTYPGLVCLLVKVKIKLQGISVGKLNREQGIEDGKGLETAMDLGG